MLKTNRGNKKQSVKNYKYNFIACMHRSVIVRNCFTTQTKTKMKLLHLLKTFYIYSFFSHEKILHSCVILKSTFYRAFV